MVPDGFKATILWVVNGLLVQINAIKAKVSFHDSAHSCPKAIIHPHRTIACHEWVCPVKSLLLPRCLKNIACLLNIKCEKLSRISKELKQISSLDYMLGLVRDS